MKVTIDIECTPQEARQFLGLPDVEPVQQAILRELQAQTSQYLGKLDPDSVLRTLMPAGLQGLEKLQQAFWSNFVSTKPDDGPSSKE